MAHEGAIRKEGGNGPYSQYPTLSPSGLAHAGKPNGRAATLEEMETIKAAFVKGALDARQLGACGVEVHACHGYLLDQFLWAETNRLTDGYGGDDMAARLRFPAEIVSAIRSAVGPDFIISFRFQSPSLILPILDPEVARRRVENVRARRAYRIEHPLPIVGSPGNPRVIVDLLPLQAGPNR